MDDDVLIPADLNASEEKPSGGGGPSRGPLWAALAVLVIGLGVIVWFGRRLPDVPPPRPTPMPMVPTPTPDPALRLEAEALNERLPEAPQRLLEVARVAMEAGRAEESVAALDALLMMEPGHAGARALRPRAAVSDQTFAARERALDAMEEEDWAVAFLAINRAVELDADFPDVRSLHVAIREKLAGEVLDREAIRERERVALREKALALEADEDWAAAHRAWLELGTVWEDDSVAEGIERTREFRLLEERIARAMGAPRRGLANELAADVQAWEGPELPEGLAGRANAFLETWRLERTPVPVRFTSDAETEVVLLRVARWNPFVERNEELLPGTYVAVGSRLGYRDIRVPFTVPAGSEGMDVDVRVVEGLR